MPFFRSLLVTLAILIVCGCSESGTTPDKSSKTPLYTVQGSMVFAPGASIPKGTKLYAVWSVNSTSPDYSYVFGEGTLDTVNGRFSFSFMSYPPEVALNGTGLDSTDLDFARLGVAYIIAVYDSAGKIKVGTKIYDLKDDEVTLVGAVNNTAIIYRRGADKPCSEFRPWLPAFTVGYGIGQGAPNPQGSGYDIFVPVSSGSELQLLIDSDPESFTFPNWN